MSLDIDQLTAAALDAFWDSVASCFPASTTGDLSPQTAAALSDAADKAVREWLRNNAGKQAPRIPMSCSPPPTFHTPGPWFVDSSSPLSPLCIKPYPGRIVCDIDGIDAEAEANARLIAASPELLAACDGACGLLYRDKRGTECIDVADYQRAENACKCASAKAREPRIPAVA